MALPVLSPMTFSSIKPAMDPFTALSQGITSGEDMMKQLQEMKQKSASFPLEQAAKEETLKQAKTMDPLRQMLLKGQIAGQPMDDRLKAAKASVAEQQAKFLPVKMLTDATQVQQTGQRFGPGYQTSKILGAMSPAQRDNWVAQNTAPYNKMLANMGNEALNADKKEKTGAAGMLQTALGKAFPSSQQAQGAQQAGAPDKNQLSVATPEEVTQTIKDIGVEPNLIKASPGAVTFDQTDAEVEQAKNMNYLAAARKNTDSSVNQRAGNAVVLDKWLGNNREQYRTRINDALHYAGLLGRGEKIAAQWGNEDQSRLSNWNWFNTTFKTTLANQMKFLEKMSGTDQQRNEINGVINLIDDVKSNPKLAGSNINKMFGTLQDLSSAVFDGAEPFNYKGIYRKAYNLKTYSGNYLDAPAKAGAGAASGGTIRMVLPDGRNVSIHSNRVDDAIKLGAKRAS